VNWAYSAAKKSKRPSIINLNVDFYDDSPHPALDSAITNAVKNGIPVIVHAVSYSRTFKSRLSDTLPPNQ